MKPFTIDAHLTDGDRKVPVLVSMNDRVVAVTRPGRGDDPPRSILVEVRDGLLVASYAVPAGDARAPREGGGDADGRV